MWELTVGSVMTEDVIAARPRTTFKELVGMMNDNQVSGLPVVDDDRRPLGVVSEADILAKQEYQGGMIPLPLFAGRRRRARWHKSAGRTAAELMTAPAVTIGRGEPLTAAARSLAAARVRRLCVVDDDGVLVGVVSRRDVVGAFLRDDEQITADIEEHVFRRGMWLFPGTLTVVVSDGVATLDGKVEHRTTAQVAAQLAQAVPGVVSVTNNMRYEVDDTTSAAL